jgi:hypothetical protein
MPHTTHLRYIIESETPHWTITTGAGDPNGSFTSRRDALEAAIRDAERVRNLGNDVEICVRRRDGTLRPLRGQAFTRGAIQHREGSHGGIQNHRRHH